jgi:DeoR family transcriptional regulator, suf operon transcriptional repressor
MIGRIDTVKLMQKTREAILQYIKENGQATVDELASVLKLTPVTVRHHLDILRSEDLVAQPVVRHRTSPGRPQYAYFLAEKASQLFPKNYCDLAAKLLEEVRANNSPDTVGGLFEGVARRLSAAAPQPGPGERLPDRLDRTVAYLNEAGYVAHWEATPEGCVLRTCNCPYASLADANPELCSMDLTLVSDLLGCTPERLSRVVEGASSCAYMLPLQIPDEIPLVD